MPSPLRGNERRCDRPADHTAAVIHCSSFCFGAAPIWREDMSPFLKIISVGIDWMLYFAAVCGFSSTLSLTILTLLAERAGDLLQRRRDHPAGAAPFRPEVDDHGAGGLQHFRFEGGIRDFADGHGVPRCFAERRARFAECEPMNGSRAPSSRLHDEVTAASAASMAAAETSIRSGTSVQTRAARIGLPG